MQNKLQINFFYILLVGVAIVIFFIFLPYFQALFLGAVCAVISYPMYRKIRRACFGSRNLASIITIAVVFFLVIIPLTYFVFLLFQEMRYLYVYFTDGGGSIATMDYIGRGQIFLNRILPQNLVPETTISDIQNYFNSIYGWVGQHFTSIFINVFTFVTNMFIFLLSFFFFLRDGKKFRELIVKLSPLNDAHDERLINLMAASVRSVVKGTLLVAVIQGVLITVGLALFGIQTPVLWGMLGVVASLLPGIGAFMIILPAAGYLYFTAGLGYGLGLLLWGIMVIIFTDNILRPVLIGHGIKIHPFLVLLAVFGGLGLFGLLGFLIGPIILSLLFALMEIHPDVISIGNGHHHIL